MNSRSVSRALSALMLLAAVAGVSVYGVSCDGGGGSGSVFTGLGGGGGGVVQQPYDIQVVALPVNGIQVNRAFAVTVNFLVPGTSTPMSVSGVETLSLTKASGPGNLVGSFVSAGNGTSTLTFNNVVLDTIGSYTLQVNGPKATAAGISASFNVGAQMDLRFTAIPSGTVYRPRTFTVAVSTVDPGTLAPVVPSYPVDVTVARNPGTGSGTLSGTLMQTISGSSSAVFSGLSYSVNETISLQASSPGFSTVTSGTITFDSLVLVNPTVSASPLVNGNFSVSATINSATSGTPVAITPAITVSLTVASGGGTLSGTTSAASSGSTVTINGARYDNAGPATFTLSSTEASSVTTNPITFLYNFSVSATGATAVVINSAWSPFNFQVRDALNNLFTGAISSLSWQVVNRTTAAVVQSSTAAFSGGTAQVTPSPIGTAGGYRLEGTFATPAHTPTTVTIDIDVISYTLVDQPGPFVVLKSVRVGSNYSDSLVGNPTADRPWGSFALAGTTTGTAGTFGVLSGTLPPGLSLDGTNGTINGVPSTAGSYQFTVYARQTGGTTAQPLRCLLDVFSANESEIPATAPNFRSAGTVAVQNFTILPSTGATPVTTAYLDILYSTTSTYDGVTRQTTARIWAPDLSTITTPAPLFVMHRGRGFHFREYNNLGAHLASYGIITVSVEDAFSFYAPSSTPATSTYRSPYSTYDSGYYTAGMQSGGAFQEATQDFMLLLNQAATGTISGTMLAGYTSTATLTAPSSAPFVGKIDPQKVFIGGHSRGGGATHASHVRNFNNKARGMIYFMPFDLRYDTNTVAGVTGLSGSDAGGSPTSWSFAIRAIPTLQPRLPSLILAAERDGDLVYPFADQYGDRSVGPATQVTVFGANHNQTGDAHANDGSPYITAPEQKARLWHLVTAFIKRYSDADGRYLDGVLFADMWTNGDTTRAHYGINSWRNMAERILIDDFQDANTATNLRGGANSFTGGSRSEASIFSSLGNMASLGIRHNIMTIPSGTNCTYQTNFTAQDVNACRRVIFRLGQTSTEGYDWVTVRVRLTDSTNATSLVTIWDRAAPSTTYLPDYNGAQPYYNRFVEAQIPLSAFTGVNKASITRIEIVMEPTTFTGTRQIYMDDLRFE